VQLGWLHLAWMREGLIPRLMEIRAALRASAPARKA